MPDTELKTLLTRLHENLAVADQIDPELKALLAELDHDIRKLLGAPATSTAADLVSRLRHARTNLAAKHPVIAGLLDRVADGLAQMGI